MKRIFNFLKNMLFQAANFVNLISQKFDCNSTLYRSGLVCVLLASTVLPRLAAIGGFPQMDDSSYAFVGQYIIDSVRQGHGFPQDMSRFQLYPFLFSWIFLLPGNSLIWLRLIDLILATIAGWLFCKLLERESGNKLYALLLALCFLAALNIPEAIDFGFKNSYFPAFICFFSAVLLADKAMDKPSLWWWIGALAALGTLLRESFAIFTILGGFALLARRKFLALGKYIAGGILGAIAITIACMLIRGQFMGLFQEYFDLGSIYGAEEGRRWLKFTENGLKAYKYYFPLLLIFAVSCIAIITGDTKKYAARAIFWIFASLLPLLEPMAKIGFVYHFSICLPGMAGLCALGFRAIPSPLKLARACGICALALCFPLLITIHEQHYQTLNRTMDALNSFGSGNWSDQVSGKSNVLAAAKIIRENLPADGRIATSAFAYNIYPPAKALPPANILADLSRAFIWSGNNPEKFRQTLARNPPDIIAIGYTYQDHVATHQRELDDIIGNDPLYRLIAHVPIQPENDYGWLGFKIYKKIAK